MDEPDDAEPWPKNIGLPTHPTGLKRTMSDPSIGHVDKAAREEADATPMIPTGDANDAGYSPGTPLPDDKEGPGFEDLTIEEKAISSFTLCRDIAPKRCKTNLGVWGNISSANPASM